MKIVNCLPWNKSGWNNLTIMIHIKVDTCWEERMKVNIDHFGLNLLIPFSSLFFKTVEQLINIFDQPDFSVIWKGNQMLLAIFKKTTYSMYNCDLEKAFRYIPQKDMQWIIAWVTTCALITKSFAVWVIYQLMRKIYWIMFNTNLITARFKSKAYSPKYCEIFTLIMRPC